MLSKNKLFILLLIVVISIGLSGYTLIATSGWQQLPVITIVDYLGIPSVEDSDGGVTATVNALNSPRGWNAAYSGIIKASPGRAVVRQGDGIYTIDFHSDSGVCTGGCVGVTLPVRNLSGEMIDADTYINQKMPFTSVPANQCRSPQMYIENTIVHEAGHALGVGHTRHLQATMYPTEPPCETKKITIERDDIKAILALY